MALFKFVDSILKGEKIDIFNNGDMIRDFTFIDDIIEGVNRLISKVPSHVSVPSSKIQNDTLSHVAPWRVVNIGSSAPKKLMDFVEAIEEALGIKARLNYVDMQEGDVGRTYADVSLLRNLTNFTPQTELVDGIRSFVNWFKEYNGSIQEVRGSK